jgi:hypothetical protein
MQSRAWVVSENIEEIHMAEIVKKTWLLTHL